MCLSLFVLLFLDPCSLLPKLLSSTFHFIETLDGHQYIKYLRQIIVAKHPTYNHSFSIVKPLVTNRSPHPIMEYLDSAKLVIGVCVTINKPDC